VIQIFQGFVQLNGFPVLNLRHRLLEALGDFGINEMVSVFERYSGFFGGKGLT
jgi:hypothetical protein